METADKYSGKFITLSFVILIKMHDKNITSISSSSSSEISMHKRKFKGPRIKIFKN